MFVFFVKCLNICRSSNTFQQLAGSRRCPRCCPGRPPLALSWSSSVLSSVLSSVTSSVTSWAMSRATQGGRRRRPSRQGAREEPRPAQRAGREGAGAKPGDRAPATAAKRRERGPAERMPTHSEPGSVARRPRQGRGRRSGATAGSATQRADRRSEAAEAAEESGAVRGAPPQRGGEARKEHRYGWGHGARPRERRNSGPHLHELRRQRRTAGRPPPQRAGWRSKRGRRGVWCREAPRRGPTTEPGRGGSGVQPSPPGEPISCPINAPGDGFRLRLTAVLSGPGLSFAWAADRLSYRLS